MALPVRSQLKYWGAAAVVFLLLLWWLGNVILPFVLGAGVAYLLDPVADRLERIGLSRGLSVAIIAIVMLLLFVALVLLVIPTLISQAVSLSERLAEIIEGAPGTVASFQEWISTRYPGFVERFPDFADIETTLRNMLTNVTEALRSRAGTLVEGALASFSGFFNVIILFLIVPVVAVYLLIDWDRMIAKIDDLLPREHAPTIRRVASDIDDTLAGFLRGQGLVCLILGVYYAAALAIVGLQFGLIVGAIAGFLTFIPYVGALVGGILAIGLALFQFWGDWVWIIAVWAIFQSGQFVEGNFLTPKLVGDSVGLHPVWLLFALSAFGAVFGFVGLLVAVPLAASLGVIARFLTAQYRDSALYRGTGGDGTDIS
ncbi:AI-2 transport protein TqsA [Rhodobacteraceae bacterium THAF1]|uniref:AI-2E family transporter n=1 Tax=Palleronia sp. THAF1 TaxID=2587842 RepID=UPI000F3B065C|nr:AI-2E family transporter [Palleronia sp. THAF1]QFU09336.1 AI-2 transport protein TqsA [Palleronia sp. THAF1]VDC26785.1 AI-2 transport protein TqsA [Rhodobacteraceae bacterium THAF1]